MKKFAAEFDPQPFHLDEEAALDTIFRGLTAAAGTRLRPR
jgi:acyl dehydratase